MIDVPKSGRIWLYGPAMTNVISKPVDRSDLVNLEGLRDYMLMVLNAVNGIGLSSPQVGVFKRFAMIKMASHFIIDLVNPRIVGMYDREIEGLEACLSLPPKGNQCLVPRMQTVKVEYSSVEEPERQRIITLHGQDAVVAQHEIDHLDGTFFVDRVSGPEKRKVIEKFRSYQLERKQYEQSHSRKQPVSCK